MSFIKIKPPHSQYFLLNRAIMYCLAVFLLFPNSLSAQNFKDFKSRLKTEAAKYRATEPCEATTKKAVENLNNLIWADNPVASAKEEIVKSCGFLRTKGCPQANLLNLLKEISDFYRTGTSGTTTTSSTNPTNSEEDAAPITNMPDTLISPEDETPVVQPSPSIIPKPLEAPKDWILYGITALLSLICIGLGYKIFTSNPSVNTQKNLSMNNEMLEKVGDTHLVEIIRQLRDELGLLRRKISDLESELQVVKSRLDSMDQKATEENVHITPTIEKTTDSHEATHEDAIILPREIPAADPLEKRYALYMDNSEGFSVSGLMYHEGVETIYEITLSSPKSASYRISNNKEAQSYALSDPGYYLRTACDYENSPSSGKRIETLQAGSVELIGNIWKITKRAKIKFS